ncbi:hypothetical protein D3C86_2130800 [compost metagenome]
MEGHRGQQPARLLVGQAVGLGDMRLMIADLADHRLRRCQPANDIGCQPRVRLDERLHRRGKTGQVRLQALP